jgi:hypothetical protein
MAKPRKDILINRVQYYTNNFKRIQKTRDLHSAKYFYDFVNKLGILGRNYEIFFNSKIGRTPYAMVRTKDRSDANVRWHNPFLILFKFKRALIESIDLEYVKNALNNGHPIKPKVTFQIKEHEKKVDYFRIIIQLSIISKKNKKEINIYCNRNVKSFHWSKEKNDIMSITIKKSHFLGVNYEKGCN